MSRLSRAVFKFRIARRLLSASVLSLCSSCWAATISFSSNGEVIGRGNFPRPSCTRKLWIMASRSCNADRCSDLPFDDKLIVSAPIGIRDVELLPPNDAPFLRRGVFVALLNDTSMFAICNLCTPYY